MDDSPVTPYTGFDAAMAHDQKMLAHAEGQIAAGVPLDQVRIPAPLRMPGQWGNLHEVGDRPKAAADFSQETLRNLDQVYERLETQPPSSAVVVNFHPLVLRPNGGRTYYQSVDRCTPEMALREAGRQCTYLLLEDAAIDPVPQESGNHTFNEIFPLWMAQNYMNVANSNAELWGIGAFVYEGDLTPEEMWEENPLIKTFTDMGMPQLTEEAAVIKSRRSGGLVNGKRCVPVMRPYQDVYMETFKRRNESYFQIVQRVDSEYHQLAPEKRKNAGINGMTRDQAQVCLNLGLLLKPPIWLTQDRLSAGVAEERCSNCKGDLNIGVVMCLHCNEPVDPFQAFVDGKINVEHLALTTLDDERLTAVYKLDYDRKDKIKKAKQAAGDLRRQEGKQTSQ